MLTGEKLGEALAAAIRMKGVSKADVARHFDVKPPSVQGWLKHGRISKSHIEKLLAYFSDVVGPEHWGISSTGFGRADLGPAVQTPLRPVVVVESDDQVPEGMIIIPRYTVKASAGHGEPVLEIDTEGQPNYFRSGWAQKNGYKPDGLFSIVAMGDSMEPTIPNGASLIVHRQTEIVSGRVHVLCRGDECYVKRLIRQMDGSILVKSENPDYKDVLISPDDPMPLHIVGLVVSVMFNL